MIVLIKEKHHAPRWRRFEEQSAIATIYRAAKPNVTRLNVNAIGKCYGSFRRKIKRRPHNERYP